MDYQVRSSIFETNSSSTHSFTMCSRSTYDKWEEGLVYFDGYRFVTLQEVVSNCLKLLGEYEWAQNFAIRLSEEYNFEPTHIEKTLKLIAREEVDNLLEGVANGIITEETKDLLEDYFGEDSEYYTVETYFDNEYLESFESQYTTEGGEEVVAFGVYGQDG